MTNPYDCPFCEGNGVVECPCCGHETECEDCEGIGLDDNLLDVQAFLKDSERLTEQGATWDWIEEGVVKGRRNHMTTLAYDDYKR